MGFSPELIEFYSTSFLNFLRMPNLDIIYDVTIAITRDEINTYKWVIYQPTFLPSFVTFDGFCFSPWLKTLSFGGNGREIPSNGPPRVEFNISFKKAHYNVARALVLSNSHCVIMNQISMDARPCSIKVLHKMTCTIHFSCKIFVAFSASSFALLSFGNVKIF